MDHIPKDIVLHIMSFMFHPCECCRRPYHFSLLYRDFEIIEYRSVFDDDFWDPPGIYFRYICFSCMINLSSRIMCKVNNMI